MYPYRIVVCSKQFLANIEDAYNNSYEDSPF